MYDIFVSDNMYWLNLFWALLNFESIIGDDVEFVVVIRQLLTTW